MMKYSPLKNCTITKNKLIALGLTFIFVIGLSTKMSAQGSIGNKTASVNGNSIPFFKNNVTKTSYDKTYTPSTATTNGINSDINNLFGRANGAVLLFKKGTYTLGEIKLKSKIRIEVEAGVTFKIDRSGGNSTLFNFGRNTRNNNNDNDVIKDVEIRGIGGNKRNQWFKIDLSNFNKAQSASPFKVAFVNNFAISNFFIKDKYTKNPSVFIIADSKFSGGSYDLTTFHRIPQNGVIHNGYAQNIATGYATAQIYSGRKIYFKNISGKKGITIRLEPGSGKGFDDLNKVPNQTIGNIEDVLLDNINNDSGFASLFIKPHTKLCKNIEGKKIKAKNSLSALYVASASLTPLSRRGTFTNTRISNIELRQTNSNNNNDYPADTGLEGFNYAHPDFRALMQGKRNADSPKKPILTYVSKDAGGERWTQWPIAPVIYAAAFSKTKLNAPGQNISGRYRITINEANITKVGSDLSSQPKVIYRGEAVKLVDGNTFTSYINK
ncbi:hypothetical protein [Flavivirga rizhaonensis]|uniref:Pectate lyase superfamily protein domain-containing protein n=1 Tax=Flavivirga rizhaonensis TaxID=2559571 RepID=A0A4S1DZZ7_9FLAO|nr:hypothetical protein [Flavivirga rizhaonensis]TGV03810.1 hypothetical protein EM932_05195 [Flavivirga rizhaonensis]